MKTPLFTAAALLVAWLVMPAIAAQPSGPAATDQTAPQGGDEKITFDAYREWRLNYIERRRSELATQLTSSDLPAERKARLQQVKEYYDWFANLPAPDRDRRFRERFDRIDANHDGEIDPNERSAWREKQRAFYHREGERSQTATAR